MVTSLGVVLCKLQAKYELASYDQSACTTIILMSTVYILYNYMQYHTSGLYATMSQNVLSTITTLSDIRSYSYDLLECEVPPSVHVRTCICSNNKLMYSTVQCNRSSGIYINRIEDYKNSWNLLVLFVCTVVTSIFYDGSTVIPPHRTEQNSS